jgi:hypothetical protein
MNQATQDLLNNDGSGPVPATVIGSGRVQALESARADTLAWPGSLSYGLRGVSDLTTMVRSFTVQNLSNHRQAYRATASVRYSDYEDFAGVRVAVGDEQLATSRSFTLGAGQKVKVHRVARSRASLGRRAMFGWAFFGERRRERRHRREGQG